jgi:predicted anti-sigma-YlaC factor YlaD
MEVAREPSDRSFGFLVAAALMILGSRHRWAIAPGVAMAIAAAFSPRILRGPKRAWLFFGNLLSLIANPLVLGVLFFGVITPAGLLMRAFGRDPLRLKARPGLPTYWIERSTPSSDMTEEF